MNGRSSQSPVQKKPAGDGLEMGITVSSPSVKREETSAPQSAVFVAHGMGQQRKYETLDLLAFGLINFDYTASPTSAHEPQVITIDSGDGYLHGVKPAQADHQQRLTTSDGGPPGHPHLVYAGDALS